MTQQRWRELAQWPLLLTALAFVAAYSVQVIAGLHGLSRSMTTAVIWIAWLVFAVDYVVNLVLTRNRRRWFLRHLHELAFVVLPALRPLQLLRLLSLVGIFSEAANRAVRGRFVLYALSTSAVVAYLGALVVLDLERDAPDAVITTFADSLWWSVTTVVGVGELFTVTWPGRVVALGLMITGLVLVGSIAGALASWLVDQEDDGDDEARERITRARVEELHAEVRQLHAKLDLLVQDRSLNS